LSAGLPDHDCVEVINKVFLSRPDLGNQESHQPSQQYL
jgi:hypothetical protein